MNIPEQFLNNQEVKRPGIADRAPHTTESRRNETTHHKTRIEIIYKTNFGNKQEGNEMKKISGSRAEKWLRGDNNER